MNKIGVFTGTRAEYGLLHLLLDDIHQSNQAELQLYVGGTHLSKQHGYTLDQIEADGFTATAQLDFFKGSESVEQVSQSLATCIQLATTALSKNKPDILVLLGDRYELLGVAQAAMLLQIPIAHIHGGEITEGAMDDAIRHAISKMSHLHFTSTQTYRNRLVQMGEQPSAVFNVGAPGLDHINMLEYMSAEQLSIALNFDFTIPFFLVTYHPVTLSDKSPVAQLNKLLDALAEHSDFNLVITYPNADSFSQQLIDRLEEFSQENNNVLLLTSMGRIKYLSAMKLATAVVGNSSSGIIEAPSCYVPTVNIGDRQKGRLAAESVLHCAESTSHIIATIKKAIHFKAQESLASYNNPYGQGNASQKIAKHLIAYKKPTYAGKTFYDLDIDNE